MHPLKAEQAQLVTQMENVFYLTGFKGSAGFVIMTPKETLLAVDQRYWLKAKNTKKRHVTLFDLSGNWSEKLQKRLRPFSEILFDEQHMTVSGLKRWKKLLPKKRWLSDKNVIHQQRLVKTQEELEYLRHAAALGDKVLKKVLPHLKTGVSEKYIANLFRQYSNELAEGVSFDPIVAFGKNGALPHHASGETRLRKHDAILIDQGVQYQGYMSDMTRCFFIGKGLPQVQKMYEQLLVVQASAVQMVREGVRISDLAAATRALLGKDERFFTHSLGHGIGLEVHEAPGVSMKSDTILRAGMVITIEPGIYKEGVGGVRIEDTVIVTEDACEVITKSSKKPNLLA